MENMQDLTQSLNSAPSDSAQPQAVPSPYRYHKLSSLKSIRIIRILPYAKNDKQQPINVKIEEVSLETDSVFQALSYTWGENVFPSTVLCNSQTIAVTQNLYDALLNFRQADKDVTIWADAICINQSDIEEKSYQIPLMEEIYRKASEVFIWLGVETLNSNVAMQYLTKIGTAFLERGGKVLDPRTEQLDELNGASNKALWEQVYNDSDMLTVDVILSRPWFTRRWIIQEVAFAKEPILYFGSENVKWEVLAMSASVLSQLEGDGSHFFNRRSKELRGASSLALHNITKLARIRQEVWEVDQLEMERPIYSCLEDARGFECRDDKDRVFALLGIFNFGRRNPFTIEYQRPEREIFEGFARYCLRNAKDLDILSWAGISNHAISGEYLGLPSWVPDWRLAFRKPNDVLQGFEAGGAFAPLIELNDSGPELLVRGSHVDEVAAVAPHVGEFEESELACGSQKWTVIEPRYIGLWYQVLELTLKAAFEVVALNTGDENEYICGGSLSDAVGRTLILNNNDFMLDFKRHPANIPPKHVPDDVPQPILADEYSAFRNYIFLKVGDLTKTPQPRDPDAGPPPMVLIDYELMEYFSRVVNCCQDRAFFITCRGLIGLGPKEMQAGDYVSIIAGSRVPHILRVKGEGTSNLPEAAIDQDSAVVASDNDVKSRFSLVGECYTHGVMHGELWDGQDETVMEEFALL